MIPGAYEPVDWRDGKPRASGDDPLNRDRRMIPIR